LYIRAKSGHRATIVLSIAAILVLTGNLDELRAGMPGAAPAPTATKVVIPIAVFGDDQRIALPIQMQGLARSIGMISSRSERTVCTAFCVGRRTVATAAHCLFRTSGERRPDLGSFQFSVGPASARQTSAINGHRRGMHRQHVVAGTYALKTAPPIEATRDWALVRLEKPVCGDQSLLVDSTTPDRIGQLAARRRLLNVAFHGDVGNWRLSLARSCATKSGQSAEFKTHFERDFADTSALVLHDCDTGPASSGSPLLALGDDNVLRVVAMNVGTYHQTRYLVTGGAVTRRYIPANVANTAVSGSAFADHILAFARSDIIADRQQIRKLQAGLRALGHQPGPVDGIYGARTRSAVIAFELASQRAPLGLATSHLLRDIGRQATR
jgi:protease YdgD